MSKDARAPSAAVRREVWERDGGRCTFVAADGRRCDGRWMLELDHVDEDGPPTIANLRLRCRGHDLLHAEETYGRPFMDPARPRTRRGRGVQMTLGGEHVARVAPPAAPRPRSRSPAEASVGTSGTISGGSVA